MGQSENSEDNCCLYALVRWVTGAEAGSLTHNVRTSWIMDFDPNADFREESFVVSWQVPPKPKSGWPLYDAQVLEVSADLDFLEDQMERLMRGSSTDSVRSSCKMTHKSTPKTLLNHRELLIRESSADSDKSLSKLTPTTPLNPREPLRDSSADRLSNSGTKTPRTKVPVTAHQDLGRLWHSFMSTVSDHHVGDFSPTSHQDENQVKVGEQLTISKTAFIEAKLARTPSSMTMDLVRCAFSANRLRRSSYAGQKRLINGVLHQKPALKRYKKMKDIQNFVNQRFKEFSQASFGHAVNACTGNNVNKKPKKQLVDMSESEESDIE